MSTEWRTDLQNMPQGREVEILRVERAVVMVTPDHVKEPITGTIVVPEAWREVETS